MAMAAYIIGMKKLQRSLLQGKELLSRDFWSSSRMTSKQEVIETVSTQEGRR
jgi:hypothetical protein